MERKVERNKAGQQSITYSGYEKSEVLLMQMSGIFFWHENSAAYL